MSAGKSSAVAAVASELGKEVAHTPGGEDAQAALFDVLDGAVDLFAASPIAPPRRGPGRPKGSLNVTTRQMKTWLAARGYRDPLEFLAALTTGDPVEIAKAMMPAGEDGAVAVPFDAALEVLKLQVKAAGELAAYVHQRAPIAIDAPAAMRPLVVIQTGGAPAPQPGDEARAVFDLMPTFQGVSSDAPRASHGDASHDAREDERDQ